MNTHYNDVTQKENRQRALSLLCFLALAFCFSNCSASPKEKEKQPEAQAGGWTVTVKGKVSAPQQGSTITIQEIKDGEFGWQDTIQLKSNNTYSKKINLTEPGYYRINFFNKQVLNVILDKSDIEVNVDGSNPQGFYEVKGSPDLDLIGQVQEIQAQSNTDPAIEKLNKDFTAAVQSNNKEKIEQLQHDYQVLMKKYSDQIAALMVSRTPSLGVINVLQGNTLDKDQYFSTYEAVANKLKKEWPNYALSKKFISFVDQMKTTAIGQPAPEIALPNPDGQITKLSSMKGKYVLVDFWAKWCGPCRQENPNVVRVYNKYKDKGFTVFGVSLDRSKDDWLKAIHDDGLTWTHVSDLKFWQSEAAKTYGISAIPFSILVDPNGIIIDKNLRGAALDNRLAEIFKAKSN